jgi:endonuclease YncB( thermonuclease family)
MLQGCATRLLTLSLAHAQSNEESQTPVAPPPKDVAVVSPPLPTQRQQSQPLPAVGNPGMPERPPAVWHQPGASNTIVVPHDLTLLNPVVAGNTARLQSGDVFVSLYGIEGLEGDVAQEFQHFLVGQRLACRPVSNDEGFTCQLPDGTNVAEAALINGAARTIPDAPDTYKRNEAEAQAARRGLWSNISLLSPISLNHPTVRDTAMLAVDQEIVVLDGIQGLGQPYAEELQNYIGSNGDRVVCLPQITPGHSVCTLNTGEDVAKAALVNGVAIVTDNASEAYRLEQADAVANRRGIWANQPPPTVDAVAYRFVDGDNGGDGIRYIDGAPWGWVDGQYVLLGFGGAALGWGFYDSDSHWHAAPAGYSAHLNHFHPNGAGLRGHGAYTHGGGGYAHAGYNHGGGGYTHAGYAHGGEWHGSTGYRSTAYHNGGYAHGGVTHGGGAYHGPTASHGGGAHGGAPHGSQHASAGHSKSRQ